jgi:2-amino-4-hydroxy-6-hydroxymethyldihydropteridine diphosphokinase
MNKILLSIGSNINKEENIKKTLDILNTIFYIYDSSSIYETMKVNKDGIIAENNKDCFWNMVCIITSNMNYTEIIHNIKKIEHEIGRQKNKFDNHVIDIDIDILLYNQDIIKNQHNHIVIPHKDLGKCFYIDIPLLEMDPCFVHPILKLKINDIVTPSYIKKYSKNIKILHNQLL